MSTSDTMIVNVADKFWASEVSITEAPVASRGAPLLSALPHAWPPLRRAALAYRARGPTLGRRADHRGRLLPPTRNAGPRLWAAREQAAHAPTLSGPSSDAARWKGPSRTARELRSVFRWPAAHHQSGPRDKQMHCRCPARSEIPTAPRRRVPSRHRPRLALPGTTDPRAILR